MNKHAFWVLAVIPLLATGDQWDASPELKSDFEVIGLKVERVIGAIEANEFPVVHTNVYSDGVLTASYRNFTFHFIEPFFDGKYAVAINNSYFSGFAYFVLDNEGGLVKAVNHRSEGIEYCTYPNWVNADDFEILETAKNIALEPFGMEGELTVPVAQIKLCNGEYLSIF